MQSISQVINKPDNKNVMDNIDLVNENWEDSKGTDPGNEESRKPKS